MSNIFIQTDHNDPEYAFFDKYRKVIFKGLWTPAKYQRLIEGEVAECQRLPRVDKETINKCILAVAMVEDKVKTFWSNIANDYPQTIIGDVGGLFAYTEVVHRISYAQLMESLYINPQDVKLYPVLNDRINYLTKYLKYAKTDGVESDFIEQRRKLKKLCLFTTLVEKCSLFTQFYILMSFAKNDKGLKSISSLQQSTAIEENIHYTFGLDIINIIKNQNPNLWDNYVIELVEKNIKAAYKAELKLIDWFFEEGVPDHLSKKEVINFLNYNFNIVCNDLGLDLNFDFDKKYFDEVNHWFVLKTTAPVEPDFFMNAVGSYSSSDEQYNLDELQF